VNHEGHSDGREGESVRTRLLKRPETAMKRVDREGRPRMRVDGGAPKMCEISVSVRRGRNRG